MPITGEATNGLRLGKALAGLALLAVPWTMKRNRDRCIRFECPYGRGLCNPILSLSELHKLTHKPFPEHAVGKHHASMVLIYDFPVQK